MNSYFDFYKSMIDNQKTMLDGFMGFMPVNPTTMVPEQFKKQYDELVKNQKQMYENLAKYWGNNQYPNSLFTDPLKAWEKSVSLLDLGQLRKMMGLEESKVFEKMLNANKFYLSMQKFYDDIKASYLDPSTKEFEKIVDESVKQFDTMFRESMLPLLPNEIKPFVENPYDFAKTALEVTSKVFTPWKESLPELQDAFIKAQFSKEALVDYVKLWKDNYNQTAGVLLKSPVVGSSRAVIEQQNKAVDATVEMILTTLEFLGKIASVTGHQGKFSIDDWIKELKQSGEPKSFKEFYDYWTAKIEGELEKFFYTDEYATLLGKTVEAAMKYKIESDKLAEKYLSNTVIVTKGQIDSLYKTVYELKKELRSLKKELKANQATIENKVQEKQ